jgi:D-glycero-D-manno-heptose 1,7-bisphosphate phosphatase
MANAPDSLRARTVRTVFLDRDGVLNEKLPEGRYVSSGSDFRLLPGVPEAIASLNRAGLRVIVVSNQRGIALGLYSAADVERIHAGFQGLLKAAGAHVDGLYFCPHDKGQCQCRKPLPGLFEQAAADFPEIDSETSLMIGDSLSDIEFGRGLGMGTILIDGALENRKPGTQLASELADLRFSSLKEAAQALLAGQASRC